MPLPKLNYRPVSETRGLAMSIVYHISSSTITKKIHFRASTSTSGYIFKLIKFS